METTQLTKSGVAYDLSVSPHKIEMNYHDNKLIYTFSSQLYKNKFMEKMTENRKKINHSLSKRFGFNIENNMLCDIKLYITIEKRGFLIDNTKERYECLSTIKLDGKNLTTTN